MNPEKQTFNIDKNDEEGSEKPQVISGNPVIDSGNAASAPQSVTNSGIPVAMPSNPYDRRTLKLPWLHLIVYATVNALILGVMYVLLGIVLLTLPLGLIFNYAFGSIDIFGAKILSIEQVLFVVEIVAAIKLFFLRYRKFSVAIPRILIATIIIIIPLMLLIAPSFFTEQRAIRDNPLQVGSLQVDISKDNVINSRKSSKSVLAVSSGSVVWTEHTKESPPYAANVWDLFLFTFDKVSGKGEIKRMTNTEDNIHKSPNSVIINTDAVYWTVDAELFRYDISTGKTESIKKDVGGIYGINGNVALVSGVAESGVVNGGAYDEGLYLVNITNNEVLKDLSKYELRGGVTTAVIGKDAYCPYNYDTGIVTLIPLTSVSSKTDIRIPGGLDVLRNIVTCNQNLVVYTDREGLKMYDMQSVSVTIVDQTATNAQAKIVDGSLYYSSTSDNTLKQYDLMNGNSINILEVPENDWLAHRKYWDVDGDFLVYLEKTGEYTSNVRIKSLSLLSTSSN